MAGRRRRAKARGDRRDERRPDRSRRVHRCTGDRAAEHGVEGDGAANGDRGSLTDGPGVGRDGHDDEHEEEAQHELPEEGLALRAAGERRSDVGDVAERAAEERGGGERADELSRPVAEDARPGEVAADRERGVTAGSKWAPEMCPTA